MNKSPKLRQPKGFTVALITFASFLVLLPVGLYSFEVARSNLARTQLQSALDAATLAAASFAARSASTSGNEQADCRAMARRFLLKQMIMSGLLSNVTQSDTVDTDKPLAGDVNFDLTIDSADGLHTKAVYGLRPAFGQFLGLGTQPIRVTAGAGYTGLTGDICIVLDISDSLAYQSKSLIVRRTYMKKSDTVVYKPIRTALRHPALGRLGARNGIPDPSDPRRFAIDASPKLKELFNGWTNEEKIAALVEAKRGNLESMEAFTKAKCDKGILKGKITPGPGFQEAYQRLAIQNVRGLQYEKDGIYELLDQIAKTPGGHLSLVTFGPRPSGKDGLDFKDSYDTFKDHGYPHVNLSKSDDNQAKVREAIGPGLTHLGTDIKGALRKAREILTSSEHRADQEQTIVLLTDGLPTTGNPAGEAQKCGEAGIRIFGVGYYKTDEINGNIKTDPNGDIPYPDGFIRRGEKMLNRIRDKCGNGSQAFVAPTVPQLKDIMRQIGHGTLALTSN